MMHAKRFLQKEAKKFKDKCNFDSHYDVKKKISLKEKRGLRPLAGMTHKKVYLTSFWVGRRDPVVYMTKKNGKKLIFYINQLKRLVEMVTTGSLYT